ncbi:MAG: hypothetical protein MI920_18085 [Kiloniellales bacterium]|nr:hypothetical protein [Kiloniellales bacterium]
MDTEDIKYDHARMKTDKDLTRYARDQLYSAFVWEETPEGYDYWSGVAYRLLRIADTVET